MRRGSPTFVSCRASCGRPWRDHRPRVHGGGCQRRAGRASRATPAAARSPHRLDRIEGTHHRRGRVRRWRCRRLRLVPPSGDVEGGDRVPRRSRHPSAGSGYRIDRLSGRARRRAGVPVLAPRRGRHRVLPRRPQRLQRAEASVSERPIVAVLGATPDEPPPGIGPADELAELRYAGGRGGAAAAMADPDAIFSWGADRSWLEASFAGSTRVRWIQAASDGVDGLLFPALVDSDVVVTNARGIFDDPIAEWAIAAMLAFTTGLQTSIVDQTRGVWTEGRRRDRVSGQHLVVVGPGPIGRATAARARALGMTVEAVGRSERTDDVLGSIVGPDGFHEALGRADHVLDALPLTAGTRAMFDAKAFDAMRPTAHFLNVGRGATVDEDALIDAVRSGAIAGA